jgi:hypothetical protein
MIGRQRNTSTISGNRTPHTSCVLLVPIAVGSDGVQQVRPPHQWAMLGQQATNRDPALPVATRAVDGHQRFAPSGKSNGDLT